jgi:hypothetical protein
MEEMAAAAPFTNRAFPDYGLMFPPPAETASSNSSGLGHRPAPFSAQLPTQLRKLRDPAPPSPRSGFIEPCLRPRPSDGEAVA